MAIQEVRSFAPDEVGIRVYGEPTDVGPLFIRGDVQSITIGGYYVKDIGDAQHDGHPAKRFTLAVDNGREVGRLVVMTDVTTEYTFEFDVLFVDSDAADRFVDRIQSPQGVSKVCQATVDLVYEGDLTETLADISASHGVLIYVVKEAGPGGGWPTVKLVGHVDKVRVALMDVWEYDEDVVDQLCEAVSV